MRIRLTWGSGERGPQAWHVRRHKPPFRDPQGLTGRTALLDDSFAETRLVRRVPAEDLIRFRPEVIVGSLDSLLRVADRGLGECVSRAAVVLTRWPDDWQSGAALFDEDRDRLWRAFRVPVFEYLVGQGRVGQGRVRNAMRVIAAECEAHDGLHVAGVDLPWLHASGDRMPRVWLDWADSPCGCGMEGRRLVVQPAMVRTAWAAAAAGD